MLIRLIAAASIAYLAAPACQAGADTLYRPQAERTSTAAHPHLPAAKRHARAALHRPHLATAAPPMTALAAPRFEPAPVPNLLIDAPRDPQTRKVDVTPALFHAATAYTPSGDGYVYGSSPQGLDDRRNNTIPGLTMSVPFN